MAQITWTDYPNGEPLDSVRSKINTFNTSVRDEVNSLGSRVTSVEALSTPTLPTVDGRYVLSLINGVATWETTNA